MAVSLHDIVRQTVTENDKPGHQNGSATLPKSSPTRAATLERLQISGITEHRAVQVKSPTITPSMRTGPPRTVSYVYSLPSSPVTSRHNSRQEDAPNHAADSAADVDGFPFSGTSSEFRGALEGGGLTPSERKGKKRESRFLEDSWNPLKWFQDSPTEEKPGFGFDGQPEANGEASQGTDGEGGKKSAPPRDGIRRSFSVPHNPPEKTKTGTVKWGRLRSLIPSVVSQGHAPVETPGPSVVTSHTVNITDELITGGLSTLMLRLWFERDEKGHRRIPVLLHRLRIRISDSLHPLHGNKAVFRIECEYANGAARWVIYRQLRDFISLHTHYAVSNAYNRNVDKLPDFPRTSLPYFKFLKKEGREKGNQVGHADFARLQRQVLENYLLDLIRAVMFHPTSNRLSGFLEISALSIALAHSGGAQYKAGYLQIEADKQGFGRKGTGVRAKREARWCAVRESYLVVLDQPGELTVWDVFLLDSDFAIERPQRYYRQGLSLLQGDTDDEQEPERDTRSEGDRKSIFSTINGRISKALHLRHHRKVASTPNISQHQEDYHSDSDSSTDFDARRSPEPMMLDPSTNANPLTTGVTDHQDNLGDEGHAWHPDNRKTSSVSKHVFFVSNAQTKLKLVAKNERQMLQWITALEKVAATCHYTGSNRFGSFAPIRLNVAAQWLVDGRDYFWNLSRAIQMARECIYIHDWWLSPELQMRRPNKDRYRLDRLLQRKAKEGVKIYLILYQEVSNRTTPIDSNYTKQRLIGLHPNIMVQRSPSHFQTGTFYWAHHEKLCVIDQAIAFMGGLDLCFGRWDTPQHALIDDPELNAEQSEIWPGKDYSNPRISDFHTLNKPEEDMYDRSKVPRMPWHDVSMQIVGQPARDLARHFVERWNYLLRIKNHSRSMPFLIPPPEFRPGELTQMGLTGTCELQICRSSGPWSIGTANKVEHSIQNAYLKAIQMSEHFVYIENQFFITSTVVNDIKVENRIGDALVQRICRAHRDGTPWKCCIMIPLLPGFTFPVDHSDASAIRIILECQNRTISRGPNSIFARLRKEGIDPDDYISFFSLRNWAKLRGDVLTTEQVYIHGKVCIVDDRLAIIGSANINERSQRGDRDSEIAAVIRDTDMMDGYMAGEPFKVGRFAHTLRVRLMREHLGVDVDSLYEEDLMHNDPVKPEFEQEAWDPDKEQKYGQEEGVTRLKASQHQTATNRLLGTTTDGIEQALHGSAESASVGTLKILQKLGVGKKSLVDGAEADTLEEERKMFTREGEKVPGFAGSIVPTLEEKIVAEHLPPKEQADDPPLLDRIENSDSKDTSSTRPSLQPRTDSGDLFGAPADASKSPQTDDQPPHARSNVNDASEEEQAAPSARATLRRHLGSKLGGSPWTLPTPRPKFEPKDFHDPISDHFWKNVWVACAVHNTEIFRKVFHAVPDDLVTTWKQYKDFVVHHERLNKPPRDNPAPEPVARVPSETGDENAPADNSSGTPDMPASKEGSDGIPEQSPNLSVDKDKRSRRPSRGTEPFERWERDEMEKLLGQLCGHLVLYPNRFLEGEDVANNFLFNADRLLPLPIYD